MSADELVVATRADSPAEADAIVAVLTANGINAFAAHRRLEDVFPTPFSRDGTAVFVNTADLAIARRIMEGPR